ncbi:hypothetical protein Q4S45_13830 [Massilia sp. R2A-15]|uniref:hypothetical protein n=1 Tax=Massilia sp. R2A-15 TaxID=3064278 RepID=UPI0027356578|nr:hypothetical protein [Massilia sp. R2A-15]WLI87816.1 hypothetical protein Q4S45_13830 [Massilia sp. R2A-15]
MQIELLRTFGVYTEPQLEEDEVDWHEYFGSNRNRLTWEDLHQKRLTVVLGEAGIGKTVEFQLEAKRLMAAGRPAFLLPLNILRTRDDWQLALGDTLPAFTAWQTSTEEAFFFLDAVDEARLQSHADFTRAVWIVRDALAPHMARVRLAISSRVTDWTVPEVSGALTTQLLQPINQALAQASACIPPADEQKTTAEPQNESAEELFVTTLDALSREEAQRCARHFGLQDDAPFWAAVDDGDYEFMASRPLDLRWMVELWNQRRVLGTYTQLIDANIAARLSEFNPHYQQARKALAEVQLRDGAAELAAAAEFGAFPFIALRQTNPAETRILDAFEVLRGWKPADVHLLLATAIFDEASFDRVKFHHRSVREYLAARWVDARLAQGVPLGRLEPLFAGRPNGELTLISSRRPVLAWLAAINVRARAWVVSKFPEILLHNGDPQSWDQRSADLAFNAIIAGTKTSPRVSGWFKSASEYLRVSRALSPGQIAAVLCDDGASVQARSIAYRLAQHGKLEDCAAPAFAIYRDTTRPEWERAAALAILEVAGTSAHRDQVLADIESGAFKSNRLIAHALVCINWSEFTPARLAAIFGRTQSEGDFGSGPMADAVKRDMLPKTTLSNATLILTAILESLPHPAEGKPFARFPVENQPERAWLLDVLPDCFERVLDLAKETDILSLPPLVEAAERIEAMRDSGFTDRDEFKRLHEAIKARPALRWNIALAISRSEDIRFSTNRLVWTNSCIVTFDVEDLPELTHRAQEMPIPLEEQEVWFQVGTEVAFRLGTGRERVLALRALCGPMKGPRLATVLHRYKQWQTGVRTRRGWELQQRTKKAMQEVDLAHLKANLLSKSAGITDGSDFGSLQHLLSFAYRSSSSSDGDGVDLDVLVSRFGREVAAAFSAGLKAYWKKASPPNPSNYPNGSVPWGALAALAGATLSASEGIDFSGLPTAEVEAAAQIAVWSLPGPPSWLESLHKARPVEVEAALNPWVLKEAKDSVPGNGVRGAFAMAMRCPPSIRRGLLAGTTPLVLSGAVKNKDVLKKLVPALYEDGLMSPADFDSVCQIELDSIKTESGRVQDLSWLQLWATARPHIAWNWFKQHLSRLDSEKDLQVANFAAAMAGLQWAQQPWNSATIDLLLEVSEVLRLHSSIVTNEDDEDAAFFGPPTKQMFYAIAKEFINMRGAPGHNALLKLIAGESGTERRWDLVGFLAQHAELDAAAGQQWDIERLRNIHSAFDSEPRNEAQLYDQVLARLEEVRTSIEEGPFSERKLFVPGMLEKYLQLWLAAKFQDTQNLRFSIHREEEVDDDKRTDIQLACATAKVCVEIKPLDRTRPYSASSLVEDTLKRQLVGQYLKGRNSTRGILVLMQLDDKRWALPSGTGRSFTELVEFLQNAANQIKLISPTVAELHVFGIRCFN